MSQVPHASLDRPGFKTFSRCCVNACFCLKLSGVEHLIHKHVLAEGAFVFYAVFGFRFLDLFLVSHDWGDGCPIQVTLSEGDPTHFYLDFVVAAWRAGWRNRHAHSLFFSRKVNIQASLFFRRHVTRAASGATSFLPTRRLFCGFGSWDFTR